MILRRLLPLLIILSTSSAFAEKMDIETHDIVIGKLEGVLNETPKVDKDSAPILVRLADLYSERARLKSMKEGDKGCKNCFKSKEDRTKALSLYENGFNFVDSETQGNILMQMAHLNQMLGRKQKSIELFNKIIKQRKRYSGSVVGQSFAGLGELYFKSGEFKKAAHNYQKSIEIRTTPRKPFLKYRLSWSLRNTGSSKRATQTLTTLLASRAQLEKQNDTGLDPSFWADGSHDLAGFMAHSSISRNDIAQLKRLSPPKNIWTNIFYLGTELDRLGKKEQSLMVWDEYIKNPDITEKERLEIQIRSAQAYFDLNQKTKAVQLHNQALQDWKKIDCDDSDNTAVCVDLKNRLRNFVTLWNKAEGPKPTAQLLQAYVNYLKVFGDDLQMGYWAATVANKINNDKSAIALYKECAYLAKKQNNAKILKGSLISEIQIAEKTKSLDYKEAAYKRYLELLPDGPKANEMKYQIAQVNYDRKKYDLAAQQFKALADDKRKSGALGVKSADLALDSLALLKDDKRIQDWSMDLTKKYPQRKNEYTKIHRQSVLNQVAQTINQKKTSSSELTSSMMHLRALSLKKASDGEIKAYWKNRLIIAEKTKNLAEVRLCARKILSLKVFSEKEKENARELTVWANEMEFRFAAAYKAATEMKSYQTKTSDFQLKLAVLAELSGNDKKAKIHYKDFIKKTPSLRKANQIRAHLIEKSPRPWLELNSNLAKLKRTPDILSTALLSAYHKKRNDKKLDNILRSTKAGRYPEGKMLQRLLVIKEINDFNREISKHRITSRNMDKELPKRLKLLNQAESWASRLSRQNDWTLQILIVDIIATQNARTYRDVLALRTPKGLNKQQTIEYKTLLKQKAQSFSDKAGVANKTLDELWNQSESWNQIEKEITVANSAARYIIVNELSELKKRATQRGKNKISDIIAKKSDKPSQKELVSAYSEAKKDPFNWKIVAKIKDLETHFERTTLISYLETRMNELKKGAL